MLAFRSIPSTLKVTRTSSCSLFHTSAKVSAGHSKWANIRHDKAKNDAKRSKEASMLASKIESSVKVGGAEANAQLDALVEKAKKLNVTKKIIESAIKRGTGEVKHDGPVVAEVQYEFVGPGGVAFIVNASTDNKARTVSLVKSTLKEFNASLSPCLYLFQKKGEIIFEAKNEDETLDDVFEVAIEIGAEDVEEFVDVDNEYDAGKLYKITTEPSELFNVSNALAKTHKLKDSKTTYITEPDNEVPFPEDYQKGFKKCIEGLESIAEVTEYWTNIQE
ncbi:DUF28-domain-containing protein [Suhomyces tanzawaensis NRRL Y-17324]|uniref:DUF28-domain-containing protein n=1 Tax=Suhomyces tanzawaensis NRRL Y-17324 TaxID=984487 RepID=A0A1E4SAX0_9ASCO|nr:DUF28-domain-containing protein [Suhomyces tanzawaensis NRRL Y-17324]ODV76653.1 DUF28-domain-containing protein [Suhomyces tanzawaensis NRRL Y-17324]